MMTHLEVATLTPVLPEGPVKYVAPVTEPDSSTGYDRPLANYFDTSKATFLLSRKSSSRLYDTIALAHDTRRHSTRSSDDPSRDASVPFSRNWLERRLSVARLPGNSPDYLGISPDFPGWRPRRSSLEDRRGAIPVAPSEVSTLLPPIPPIDTSSPPPSKEWLDEKARQILAAAHLESESQHDPDQSNSHYLELHFDYDNDSIFDSRTTISRRFHQHSISQPPSVESESNTDTETETDIDEESDDGYNWSTTRICEASPHALADIPRWIIPRKRSSVVISDNGDSLMDNDDDDLSTSGSSRSSRSSTPTERGTPPLSDASDDEYSGKRHRGTMTPRRAAKKLKRHSADTPARQGCSNVDSDDGSYSSDSEEDASFSERALSVPPRASISSIRSTPPRPSPPPVSSSSIQPISPPSAPTESHRLTPRRITPPRFPPRPKPGPKTFPCLLDGCTQVCASAGDLQRHQQSLRHRAPSYVCLSCGKTYTRPDALKRHLNTKVACKKEHAAKLAQGAEEQRREAEADAAVDGEGEAGEA